jgi:hypothetical protein
MRLLRTDTLEFQEFYGSKFPPYAILSHTWGDDEVTFQDMASPNRFAKKGYAKIAMTCEIAKSAGLEFAWIDTCCIDKSSSAELTESINSMFQWYKNAAVCYVFLEDLLSESPAEDMVRCRWFTRGWTLQELIAPSCIHFYDQCWNRMGSKSDLMEILASATRIDRRLLTGVKQLEDFSVAQKMSWASRRETTRVEDTSVLSTRNI